MKTTIITCFGDRTCGSFLGLSNKHNSLSRTDNFVNVFNSITSPPVLSYRFVLKYFLAISVGSHFNLTFGLKPEVGGSKSVTHVTVYKRSIFQVEWLIAALIIFQMTSVSFRWDSTKVICKIFNADVSVVPNSFHPYFHRSKGAHGKQ